MKIYEMAKCKGKSSNFRLWETLGKKLIPNKVYNIVMIVFFLFHFGIVIIGLFVDAAYSKDPKNLYHLLAF